MIFSQLVEFALLVCGSIISKAFWQWQHTSHIWNMKVSPRVSSELKQIRVLKLCAIQNALKMSTITSATADRKVIIFPVHVSVFRLKCVPMHQPMTLGWHASPCEPGNSALVLPIYRNNIKALHQSVVHWKALSFILSGKWENSFVYHWYCIQMAVTHHNLNHILVLKGLLEKRECLLSNTWKLS